VSNRPLEKLLERAKTGTATRFDAAAAAAMLPDLTDSMDRYDALFILGRVGDQTYASVVEPFVDERDDPMLARLAVQILCSWWGLGAHYLDRLGAFVAGDPWDLESGGFVQSVAVSASGEVLRQTQDGPLLRALLEPFDRDESGDDLRREAYAALLRASGKEPRDIPGTGSDAWRRPDLATLELLRQRAKL
jgi:hypothetical protein